MSQSSPADAAAAGWSGALVVEPGLLAFTGRIGTAAAHAHACLQILHVTTGAVHLSDEHGDTRRAHTAIIPTGVRHALTAEPDAKGLIAYLDPASTGARAASHHLAALGPPEHASTWTHVEAIVPAADPAPLHPGLRRAVDLSTRRTDGPPDLTVLAGLVGLSASRLGHLFHDQLRLPYPAWRRWTRLRNALDQVRAGATLTQAAHAAGFTDSAHLTRTCRAMFGLTPTEALRAAGWRA
ncbi:helix-turn-helix transcriptional regulator [Cryptosporangium minutisporangium]|uniref:AraC family transcriptional regulator n=1 Tax=Cryptosporangium minutisporangium TaxID=113569 RepID=A0ABP6SYS9_9ACTN